MAARVRLLGRPRVEDDSQPRPQPRGVKSWAVLARVALTRRPVPRRELAAELFPDADDPLGALRWSLADLRRALALPAVLRGDPLRLGPDEAWLDVWALEDGTLATDDVGAPLLDGVDLPACPEFGTWLLLVRARCAARSREELRARALDLLAGDDAAGAEAVAGRAAGLDVLDEDAQELFLRALVAAGHAAQASVHLATCTAALARAGITPSPALQQAAWATGPRPRSGVRAAVVARSLLRAGSAALAAGAADAGVETLRRAAEEAERSRDPELQSDVLTALGGALVHAVRGFDGEGALVLNRALVAARAGGRAGVVAEVLRELAFVDVQAGRHASAARALREAMGHAAALGDPALTAGLLAVRGMNAADRGRHASAIALLTESAGCADRAGRHRQQAWSLGVLARSLLPGQVRAAHRAAEASIALAQQERWNAFLPWPQVLRAQTLAAAGSWASAAEDAENAFALACELGDPCWEGMAARALGLFALHAGDTEAARSWTTDARQRCDRVPDRYVWVSAYIGLADLVLASREGPGRRRTRRRDCTTTPCGPTSPSCSPGPSCTKPSPATAAGSRSPSPRRTASTTPRSRPGCGPSPTFAPDRDRSVRPAREVCTTALTDNSRGGRRCST